MTIEEESFTTHKKFGEDFGILAGDGLLNLAYETMLSAIHKAAKTGDAQAVFKIFCCRRCDS